MFDLESRKKNTKFLINLCKHNLYKLYPNNYVNGLFVLVIHWLSVGIPLIGLFIFKLDWTFYISTLIWILICILHFYFNGCIFTKLERELWETKEWYGPWFLPFNLLKKYNVDITSNLANNIFICWGILIICWIIMRIIFQTN